MNQYDVVIIGSGLGGLECGYILSKKGYKVCILEKNTQLGGCLQTFKRGTNIYDTGFHFVGGLDEGQFLHTLFKYFDLLGLPWHRMDEHFAEIVLNDHSYYLSSGHDNFVNSLSKEFPHQKLQLIKYAAFLKQVGNNIGKSLFSPEERNTNNASLFEQSAYAFLQETIDDPLLRKVLSGGSLTMELCAEKLPLYIFAQINNSFIQSAWRLQGGGSLIANKLAESIRNMGGTIINKAKVTKLIENDGHIQFVEYNNQELIAGKNIISNLHPALTLSLIPESKHIRKIYRNRITRLPNTFGMFTVHLELKENSIPYFNRNIFVHRDHDIWDCSYHPNAQRKVNSILISSQVPVSNSNFTSNIDILTAMHWEEMSQWYDTDIGKRGEEYEDFKVKIAEKCIKLATSKIPDLKNNIIRFYTSTPLTYRDYTGTWEGSAYGIQKDHNNVLQTILTPKTPLANLFLTGQNLNLHGILGVTMTSFFTCAMITGMESLVKELKINI